jgi:hypothetical protein
MDVIIIVIPIPLIWHLNLAPPKKVATIGVFLLGLGTVAVSATRLMIAQKAASEFARILDAGPVEGDRNRIILAETSFTYWVMVESGIAVMVANLPTLWFFPKNFQRVQWGSPVKALRSIANGTRALLTKQSQHHHDNGAAGSKEGSETALNEVPGAIYVYPLRKVVVERSMELERL